MTPVKESSDPLVRSLPLWRDRSSTPQERARALLRELTLEEKVGQLGSVWMTDAGGDFAPTFDGAAGSAAPRTAAELVTPHGLGQITRVFGTDPVTVPEGVARLIAVQQAVISQSRHRIPALVHEESLTGFAAFGATAYPTPLAWAATFDEDLVGEMAARIGHDLSSVGVHQALAPVLDVVRDYRWGRVEETLGEDPYLVGQLAARYVAGLESAGIVATLKHFAGYAASRGGRNHAPVSVGIRELRDIVFPPFEAALGQGKARSVMNAYNDIDGLPAAANAWLLTDVLRGEWGFEGTVVADYWAIPFLASMHGLAADAGGAGLLAIEAGIDVELPETVSYGASLVEAVRSGKVAESLVDRSVLRHLLHKIEAGLLDGETVVPADAHRVELDSDGNRAVARRMAAESLVLLDNPGGILPFGGEPWPRTSASVSRPLPKRIAVIGAGADDPHALLGCYAFPNHVLSGKPRGQLGIRIPTIVEAIAAEFPESDLRHAPGGDVFDAGTAIVEAVAAAREADAVVLVVGDVAGLFGRGTSGEGCDAPDLRLPGNQDALARAVIATGTPTVLVVVSGRPYALGAYSAAARVQAFFPGEEGADAIAGLLSGRYRPSGRLPVQIPADPAIATTYLQPPLGAHNPGISMLDPTPLFAFGHGVTAAPIEYESLSVDSPRVAVDGTVEVTLTLRNRGSVDSVEVVQLYQRDDIAQVTRPRVQLLAFARIAVAAGARRSVEFRVPADLFAFAGVDGNRIVEPGTVTLSAGRSASDRPLAATVELIGDERPLPHTRATRAEWTALDGSPSCEGRTPRIIR
jgi:beta-xylosidase